MPWGIKNISPKNENNNASTTTHKGLSTDKDNPVLIPGFKITGLILFIAPLILIKNNYILFEIIICSIATFAAIQEGYYIKNNKLQFID